MAPTCYCRRLVWSTYHFAQKNFTVFCQLDRSRTIYQPTSKQKQVSHGKLALSHTHASLTICTTPSLDIYSHPSFIIIIISITGSCQTIHLHFDSTTGAEVGAQHILETNGSCNVQLKSLAATSNVRIRIDQLERRRSPVQRGRHELVQWDKVESCKATIASSLLET